MADKTKIEWTQGGASWNPWHGCIKVSPGCKNCYMYTEKKAYGQDPSLVVRSKTKFNDPLKWVRSGKPPKFCFTCSWSDFFIDSADEWRPEAWEIIRKTPQITYQILTKRPERIAAHLPADWSEGYPNVWLGVSVESPEYLWRIESLLRVAVAIKWVSLEPLLGALDLQNVPIQDALSGTIRLDSLTGNTYLPGREDATGFFCGGGLRWVVVGGESGPKARPMHPDWARLLRDQCAVAGVPFFFKQVGEWAPYEPLKHGSNENRHFINFDGRFRAPNEPSGDGLDMREAHGWAKIIRVGKKAAGRLLDGKEHNQYP